MTEPRGATPPTNLSVKVPPDVASTLHRLAYETGRTKGDLVVDAVRQTYMKVPTDTPESA